MKQILKLVYRQKEINGKRREIIRKITDHSPNIKNETIRTISSGDLHLIFGLYDEIFLDDWFGQYFKGEIKFSLSRRMTKSAGITICPKRVNGEMYSPSSFEIRIGIDFFLNYDLLECDKVVCGIKTDNSLEALLVVFEHELCHVLEFIHFSSSSCQGEQFKALARNIFGHSESHHQLPTHKSIVADKLGIRVGDRVCFIYENKEYKGTVSNINKRATVMVKDRRGQFVDKDGRRYVKFYVPPELLKKMSIS